MELRKKLISEKTILENIFFLNESMRAEGTLQLAPLAPLHPFPLPAPFPAPAPLLPTRSPLALPP